MKCPIFVLTGVLLLTSLPAQGQSIADVARRERERRQRAHATIVFTNESVKSDVTEEKKKEGDETAKAGDTPAAAPKATPQTAVTAPAGPMDNKGRDEKYWRNAFQQARAELKRAEDQAKTLELQINDLSKNLLTRDDLYNKEARVGSQIGAKNTDLDKARAEAAQARQKIDQLEEELRRSGGPAGWAR